MLKFRHILTAVILALMAGMIASAQTISIQLEGNAFTVTFPGGGARVQLAPDATITRQLDSSLDDVHQGDSVTMQVVDNTARTVTITTASARS